MGAAPRGAIGTEQTESAGWFESLGTDGCWQETNRSGIHGINEEFIWVPESAILTKARFGRIIENKENATAGGCFGLQKDLPPHCRNCCPQ